jgi:hypothetical protein
MNLSMREILVLVLILLTLAVFVLLPRLRERSAHFLRGMPGLFSAVLILLVFFLALDPMHGHLQAENAAQRPNIAAASAEGPRPSSETSPAAFEVTALDVLYGSVQLFTANMPPVTVSDPSLLLRLLRLVAPLVFVVWIASAFSRVARSLWTRIMLRRYSRHIVVCGPPERILELVNQAKGDFSHESGRLRIVAVTSSPVDRAVERALLKISARVIDVIPYSSPGAFANAVSRASKVLIDFDDLETTFAFAESAMQVGTQGRWDFVSRSPKRLLKWLINGPAAQVLVFLPFDVSTEFLRAVASDDRFHVEPRRGSRSRLAVEQTEVRRASPKSPLRLIVVTDDADFISQVEVLRGLFRQAEPGLVDVLLIGDENALLPIDPKEEAGWLRVRQIGRRGGMGFALRSLIDGRSPGDGRPVVPPSAPVFIYMNVYRALAVMAELDRMAQQSGAEPLPIAYIARRTPGSHGNQNRTSLDRGIRAFAAKVQIIDEDPSQLLESAMPEVVTIRLAAHLAIWGPPEGASTLGPRPRHDLLTDDRESLRAFVDVVLQVVARLDLEVTSFDEAGGRDHVLGFGPSDLRTLLEHVGGSADGGSLTHTVESFEQRGALLDLLARFPEWLGMSGFVLTCRSKGESSVRLTDDDIRLMANEAQAIYLETQRRVLGTATDDRQALSEWSLLPEEYKESNRAQVRHVPVKLALLGLDLARADGSASGDLPLRWPPLPDDRHFAAFEALSRLEHSRWSIEHVGLGYRVGPSRQNLGSGADLTHPNLVPYEDLDDSVKALDVSVVENLPRVLASAGYVWRHPSDGTRGL